MVGLIIAFLFIAGITFSIYRFAIARIIAIVISAAIAFYSMVATFTFAIGNEPVDMKYISLLITLLLTCILMVCCCVGLTILKSRNNDKAL